MKNNSEYSTKFRLCPPAGANPSPKGRVATFPGGLTIVLRSPAATTKGRSLIVSATDLVVVRSQVPKCSGLAGENC